MLLDTYAPLDLLIIMLGTNDTKNSFRVSVEQIGLDMELLARIVAAMDAGPVGVGTAESGAGTDGPATAWPPVGPVLRLLILAPTPIGTLDDRMPPHFAPESRAREVPQGLRSGPPDPVIEIVSPDSGLIDRRRKFDLYERFGVKEYWIVDQDERVVEVYRR